VVIVEEPDHDSDEFRSRALGTFLETEGFFIFKIIGDGNCALRCLSMMLYGHQRRHMHVRNEIMSFMYTSKIKSLRGPNEPEIGQWITKENFIKYDAWKKSIENSGMPNEGTWFTDKEIE